MVMGTFAAAVNCMDGRVQSPVAEWVKGTFGVQYVDMITEAGPDGILAHGAAALVESIRQRVLVSTGAHGSRVVVVAGHQGCAGNPVSPEQHLSDIQAAMRAIASWGLPVQIIGLWVEESGAVQVVGRIAEPGS
jgi:hypothetical protein